MSKQAEQPDVSKWAGWILLFLSAVVLTGYALDLTPLEKFVPISVGMKPNSALAAMLAGFALLRRRHRELPIYSIAVFLIGALTLCEYIWNVNLGIDELLFRDRHYTFYPGRISQHTSFGYVLFGASLLLMNSRYRIARRLARWFGLTTGALGLLALVSDAYNTHIATLIDPQSNVSVPTAIGFIVGAIGVQYVNRSEGIIRLLHADNAGGAMLRRLLPVGFLVSLYVGFAVTHAQVQLRWEPGFSIALAAGGVSIFLFTGTILTAASLERQDLARHESEQRFLLAAKTAPVMIWMAGTDKLCTYFSEPWLEFTGRSMDAELGNGWTDGVHDEDLSHCMETFAASFDRREAFQMQYRLRRRDGEYRWIVDTGVPRFNKDGSFAGYIGTCIDITDQKIAEEAVSDLERRVLSAQEEERTRIARELHDDINQQLALVCWDLRSVNRMPAGEERRSRAPLDALAERVTGIASEIQAISHRLHSSHLEYLGLAAATEILCREFRTKHGVEIEFKCEGVPRDLAKDTSLCLYRVLQEALQNALKHSGAREFSVELIGNESEIRLTVSDRGVGFDSKRADKQQGLGLISMRERLRLVHGDFQVESEPGRGTTIRCKVRTIIQTSNEGSEFLKKES
jgi:PAS domain S-box-containing protein